MKKDGVLEAFSAATRATLKNVIAPLMVWRDVFSREAALKFDLLTARLSIATLGKSSDAADLADPLHAALARRPNLSRTRFDPAEGWQGSSRNCWKVVENADPQSDL